MVSEEALKKLQEQIAAWPMTQRFVVQPCKVGNTVIDQTFAETPRLMKNTR